MRLLSWNIRQGGGSRIDRIADALREHDADVIGLAECKSNRALVKLQAQLSEQGWEFQHLAEGEGYYRIFVAAKVPFQAVDGFQIPASLKSRWCDITISDTDLGILFVHIPNYEKLYSGEKCEKELFWESLLAYENANKNKASLIVGDMNTGLADDGPNLKCGEIMQKLMDIGWIDLWRLKNPDKTEFTWYGRSNGFRLDHAFASPSIVSSIGKAFYYHQEREQGISDHSILIVETI